MLYRIIQEPLDSWNAFGKHLLRTFNEKLNEHFYNKICAFTASSKEHLKKILLDID